MDTHFKYIVKQGVRSKVQSFWTNGHIYTEKGTKGFQKKPYAKADLVKKMQRIQAAVSKQVSEVVDEFLNTDLPNKVIQHIEFTLGGGKAMSFKRSRNSSLLPVYTGNLYDSLVGLVLTRENKSFKIAKTVAPKSIAEVPQHWGIYLNGFGKRTANTIVGWGREQRYNYTVTHKGQSYKTGGLKSRVTDNMSNIEKWNKDLLGGDTIVLLAVTAPYAEGVEADHEFMANLSDMLSRKITKRLKYETDTGSIDGVYNSYMNDPTYDTRERFGLIDGIILGFK